MLINYRLLGRNQAVEAIKTSSSIFWSNFISAASDKINTALLSLV